MFLPGSKIVVCDSNHCDERFVPVAHSTNVPVDVKIATYRRSRPKEKE